MTVETAPLLEQLKADGVVARDSAEDLAQLLTDATNFIRRFVAFSSPACADAIALWAAHCHAIEAFDSTPRLALLSPEKGSGKTRTLEVLDLLVPDPMHSANLSVAAVFRQIAAKPKTVLLADEADTYLGFRVAKEHEELRGLVNAGHRRGVPVYRCVGEPSKMTVQEFPAFCPVALAGIGDLPDTIIDRAIVIRMRRRSAVETVQPFRLRKVSPEGEALRTRLAEWSSAMVEKLRDIEPEMPSGIVDRPADVWEPLIAIGDSAGPEWSQRARRACVELQKARMQSDPSLAVQLLTDIRIIFDTLTADRISTEELVERLCKMDESPWGDLRGKAIDARGVARRLKPFDVRPKQIRFGEETRKGYELGDFLDPWARYLALPEKTETSETEVTEQVSGSESVSLPEPVSDTNETSTPSETDRSPVTRDVDLVSAVSLFPGSTAVEEGDFPENLQKEAAFAAAWNASLPPAPAIEGGGA